MSATTRPAFATPRANRLAGLISRIWKRTPPRTPARPRTRFETLEPRVLLSADLIPEAAGSMAHSFDQHIRDHLDEFLTGDTFDARVPLLHKVSTDAQGRAVNEAPTLGDLLSIPVEANGDGHINGGPFFDTSDDDEPTLEGLDGNHDGRVDASEFLDSWFFDPVRDFLNSVTPGDTTTDFENFLKGSFLFNLDQHLDQLGDYIVDFKIVDSKVHDTTENPDAEQTFSVGFQLTISHAMPIDLGLEGDALKLLPYTGSSGDPQPVNVPVDATLTFGFDFGVFTRQHVRCKEHLALAARQTLSAVYQLLDRHLKLGSSLRHRLR